MDCSMLRVLAVCTARSLKFIYQPSEAIKSISEFVVSLWQRREIILGNEGLCFCNPHKKKRLLMCDWTITIQDIILKPHEYFQNLIQVHSQDKVGWHTSKIDIFFPYRKWTAGQLNLGIIFGYKLQRQYKTDFVWTCPHKVYFDLFFLNW